MIYDGMTFSVESDLNEASPQFTLTCISTGGPATTVTWTRDSSPASGNQTTQFNGDTSNPQYTHTLTVTGRLGGLYTCTVANNKPSEDSAQLTVQGVYTYIYVCSCMYITSTRAMNMIAILQTTSGLLHIVWHEQTLVETSSDSH